MSIDEGLLKLPFVVVNAVVAVVVVVAAVVVDAAAVVVVVRLSGTKTFLSCLHSTKELSEQSIYCI